jgi:cell division septal protein FtsQ
VSTRAATGLLDRRRAVVAARHRRRRTALIGVLAAGAAVAGAWWVATGPLLSIGSVNISGYRQPDQARLVETARIAARDGTMLRLPTVSVREALTRFPWVEDVRVHHNWPRGVDIQVLTATPAAIAVTPGGARLVVSDSGRILGPDTSGLRLPLFRMPAGPVGQPLRGHAQRAPYLFLTAMSPATARRVRDLGLAGGVVTGRIVDGPELRIGPPEALWAKARALEAILASTRPTVVDGLAGAEYLDLSSPAQPTLGGLPVGEAAAVTGDGGEASTETQGSVSPSP